MIGSEWFSTNRTQALAFLVIFMAVISLFIWQSIKRARRLRRVHPPQAPPVAVPEPVMWEVYCPSHVRKMQGGKWSGYQPLNAQVRRDTLSLPVPVGRPSRDIRPRKTDVTFLIAMPSPPSYPSSVDSVDICEKGSFDDDSCTERYSVPDVVIGLAYAHTPPLPRNFVAKLAPPVVTPRHVSPASC